MTANGQRRVVITGLGMVSPLGNDVQSSWSRLLAGESGAAPITAFDHTDYNVHFACELKEFDPTVWIDRKAARRMDRFAQMILAAARQAESDSGVDIAAEADRFGASIATGIGGLQSYQECYHVLLTRGPRPREPVLDPVDHPEHGRRLGLDRARHERAADERVHRVRRVEHGDRRRDGRDPARPRRRDVRGRDGGADHAGRDRRLRRDARALAPQRRSAARVAPVRQGARRPRDGRGGRGARARGARAREGARREDLRRAARLRHLVGRVAHDRARPDRREPRARDDDGARRRTGSTRPRSAM